MRITSQRIGTLMLVGAVLFLGIAAWNSHRSITQLVDSSHWVSHTREVQSEMNLLLAELIDIEDNRRAYMLLGDSALVERNAKQLSEINSSVAKLYSLTSDNGVQQKNLNEIESRIRERLTLLDEMTSAPDKQERLNGQAADSVRSGIVVMTELRRRLLGMLGQEDMLLGRRQAAEIAAYRKSSASILIANLVALGLLLGAGVIARREIAGRQRAESVLVEQTENLRTILGGIGEGVVVGNSQGKYVMLNRAARELLHLPPDDGAELPGIKDFEFFSSDGVTPIDPDQLPLAQAIRGLSVDDVEILIRHKESDKTATVNITGRPLKFEDGRTGGVIAFRDITEYKFREKQLNEKSTQLSQANIELRLKNQEIETFYHTLSHELKTPLTSAREFVAIVLDGLGGEINSTQHEYLTLAKHSCDQIAHSINDLLDSTRLETGKLNVVPVPNDLVRIVELAVASMGPSMRSKDIRVSTKIPREIPQVRLDEMRIGQVLLNLLSNARKYTPPNGTVLISAEESRDREDMVEVSVTNTGPTIAPDKLERIFDRLYQVHQSDAYVEGGLGLGLYICRQIIQAHGGIIHAENVNADGVRVAFTLHKVLVPLIQ